MAGGVDMSFWIWVGVAIVVVLVVAFVRDRRRAASRRGDKGGTLNVASKGETLSAIRTRASRGRRQRWRVTRRPCPPRRPLSASRDGVVNLSINLRRRWEYPSEGKGSGGANSSANSTTTGLVRVGRGVEKSLKVVCSISSIERWL